MKNLVANITIRLVAGLASIIVLMIQAPPSLSALFGAILITAPLIIMVAVIRNTSLKFDFQDLTLLPVASLLCYFSLGESTAYIALTVGLIAGGILHLILHHNQQATQPVSTRLLDEVWLLSKNILALVAASVTFMALGGVVPLDGVPSVQTAAQVSIAILIFLIVYDGLLILDLVSRKLPALRLAFEHRQTILAIQILPMILAPLGALTFWQLGSAALWVFCAIVAAIAFMASQIEKTHRSLVNQVHQLQSFSTMHRALRSTLDLGSLVDNVYIQSEQLLGTRNLRIIMQRPQDKTWQTALEMLDGTRQGNGWTHPPSDPLTQTLLEKETPLLVNEAHKLPEGVGSWMGVPISASGRTLGCMLTWRKAGTPEEKFTQSDFDIFSAIASQTGVALENAMLYEESAGHAERLERLNLLNISLSASLDPERVLNLIAEGIVQFANCDKAAIYLLNETSDDSIKLELAHAEKFSPGYTVRSQAINLPLQPEEIERLLAEGEIITIENVHDPNTQVFQAVRLLAEQEDFTSYAYLPLTSPIKIVGIIAIYYKHIHRFGQTELRMLGTFANQSALAIENARLYERVDEQVSRQAEQIVSVSEIGRRLSSTLDLEQVFDLLIDSAVEATSAASGILLLAGDLHESEQLGIGGALNLVAWRGFDPTVSRRMPHHVAQEESTNIVVEQGETVINQQIIDAGEPLSQLGIPIFQETTVIGAIILESPHEQTFNDDDVKFVSQLAVQASIAIRNAQLFFHSQLVRDRLHAILDSSLDGLLMIDGRSRIVMTNSRMHDFWDFARDDFMERSPEQFAQDPLTALGEGLGYKEGELKTLLGRCIRNPNMPAQTDLYVTRVTINKRQRFVERTVTPVRDTNGNFIGLLLIFRDVTEQHELEQAREDLTSMMVHDLRGPLTAVMTSMSLIERHAEPDNAIIFQSVQTSSRAIKKLLNLINDLLDVSRLSDGNISVDASIIDITSTIDAVIGEMRPIAQELDVVLTAEVEKNLPETRVDPSMIERVILNIVDNALKYTEPGTLVALKAFRTELEEAGTEVLQVEVHDQGPGIPDEFKKSIFDRFKQVPGRQGRRYSTGIGLAFCQLAIEAHGGRIWVRDAEEGGSIFTLTIPVYTNKSGGGSGPFFSTPQTTIDP